MYWFSAQCSSSVYHDLRRVAYALWNLQQQGGYVSQQVALELHLQLLQTFLAAKPRATFIQTGKICKGHVSS